ncbi:MAG TPA: hypothetical protein VJQ26_01085 [Ktedonobacteraceae bacterium]|nr:hypothetical protein [Ktedonobacteraceae bacterium]
MKSRLVLSLGLSIGAVVVEPGVIRTANETGEIALVCGHDALSVGLSGLGWVTSDLPVQVPSLVGLAFLLFLAGLDVELGRLRGRLLRLAGLGFVLSLGLAISVLATWIIRSEKLAVLATSFVSP